MFNMSQVGINICKFRKSIGITQMELADKLGISFQAISNWERGISMPDISKLNELSTLFNVSIDEILDNKRTGKIVRQLLDNQPISDISIEEINEISPILHENHVESLLTKKDGLSIKDISAAAPFLSQEFIDGIALGALNKNQSLDSISTILPFVSASIIDEKALEIFNQTNDLSKLTCIAPFMSKDLIDSLACAAYKQTKNVASLTSIVPFISSNFLDRLAKEILDKIGLSGIRPLIPFVDSKILEEYIEEKDVQL